MEKTIRTATRGIAEELRDMEVGDSVNFPLTKYNYNSVRTTPGSTLVMERINGQKWRSQLDIENKCVKVTRTA